MRTARTEPFTTPLVSVIIPTYNTARYICQAIESALSQTGVSSEVIVIDDGSTDDTRTVLKPYRDRIRYVYQNNQGVCAARNKGVREARGTYVVFLDADDFFLPDKLADQINAFIAIPSLGIVHSGWRLVNEKGEKIRSMEPWQNAPILDLEGWLWWKPVFLGAMMFSRAHLLKVGGFDPDLRQAEDVDLVLRMALDGCEAAWLRKTTLCYRLHGTNTMRNGLQQAKDLNAVMDNFFSSPEVPWKIRKTEGRIRYYTLIWIVWQLYRTGYTDSITEYLRKTLRWSAYFPTTEFVILDWARNLAEHCVRDNSRIAELRSFWPYFKEIANLKDDQWVKTERALNWWMDVWWNYLNKDRLQSIIGLSNYGDLTVHEIIECATPVVFVNPNTTVEMISHFWRDLMNKGLVTSDQIHEIATLYLAMFAEAVFGAKLLKAFNAFLKALRYGFNLKAIRIWFGFFKSALRFVGEILSSVISRNFTKL